MLNRSCLWRNSWADLFADFCLDHPWVVKTAFNCVLDLQVKLLVGWFKAAYKCHQFIYCRSPKKKKKKKEALQFQCPVRFNGLFEKLLSCQSKCHSFPVHNPNLASPHMLFCGKIKTTATFFIFGKRQAHKTNRGVLEHLNCTGAASFPRHSSYKCSIFISIASFIALSSTYCVSRRPSFFRCCALPKINRSALAMKPCTNFPLMRANVTESFTPLQMQARNARLPYRRYAKAWHRYQPAWYKLFYNYCNSLPQGYIHSVVSLSVHANMAN